MKLYDDNERKNITKHPTCVEVGECRPAHRATKNTRDWCKGRVGIPHTWEWRVQRSLVELAQRMGLTYYRVTEEPVCFGCEKIDNRRRSYCAQCGEPWPNLHHELHGHRIWTFAPCARCGAEWMVRHRAHVPTWKAAGTVRP